MAPQQQPHSTSPSSRDSGEEIVISGISGNFPETDGINELRDNLMQKKDLMSLNSLRWTDDNHEIPLRGGKIKQLNKFDAKFFRVPYKLAHTMDPMSRILLEKTYEAIVDAGVNPRSLRGQRIGVFIGCSASETSTDLCVEKVHLSGLGIIGCFHNMLANNISYWLGINGPSYTIDTACSSSLYVFQQAYMAIQNGQCESAIVCGCSITLLASTSLQFALLGVLSPDGYCKSFDEDADGYARSDGIVVVFLQKAKVAKRVYCTVVHAAVNCDGYKEQGITHPSSVVQAELIREFYKKCNVDPCNIKFIETHTTGTKVGDPEEVNAVDQVLVKEAGRTTPLLVGSIKSNIGHTEPASGLCSVAKCIIAMETGLIPPNVNLKKCRKEIRGLVEGRLKVVTEPTKFDGGLIAVNNFGFGGANAHVLLRSNPKKKVNGGRPNDSLPRVVLLSGRTEEAVRVLREEVEKNQPPDVEFVALLHEIHNTHIPRHMYRGYTVVGCDPAIKPTHDCEYFSGRRRPIWYVFSGMGSEWPAMGRTLMQLPIFADAMKRIDKVLKPYGVDIVHIISSEDPAVFENTLNGFLGITAIQVGLVDILRAVGIEPDGIVGHSLGELGCAYADGCATAEQSVLASYVRGKCSLDGKFIQGAMAAVGMAAGRLANLTPPDLDIACHNGPESCTLSGPAESLRKFVKQLQERGVFAKEVPCGNIAYHSRYIAPAGDLLRKNLSKVYKEPKERSARWISSSVPEALWNTPAARYFSVEYQINNMISPVLFEEACRHIPSNAVTLEIGPHALLQAILKRSLSSEMVHIPMTRRGADSLYAISNALGKLYMSGAQPQVAVLYPPVEFPVSCGTPSVSPLVHWDHADDWFVTSANIQTRASGVSVLSFVYNDAEIELMEGHIIDGRPLLPATGYLKLVWEAAAKVDGKLYTQMPVVFENVRFLRATHLPKEGGKPLVLNITICKGNGRFEVSDQGISVVTGVVRAARDRKEEMLPLPPGTFPEKERNTAGKGAAVSGTETKASDSLLKPEIPDSTEVELDEKNVYKVLRLRGYNYTGLYRGIYSASPDGQRGKLQWKNNWAAFLDAFLQMKILPQDSDELYVPTEMQKFTIYPDLVFKKYEEGLQQGEIVDVRNFPELDAVVARNMEIRGLQAAPIARRRPLGEPVLEHHTFVPYEDPRTGRSEALSLEDGLRICVQVALENQPPITRTNCVMRSVELLTPSRPSMLPGIVSALSDLPLIQNRATVYVEEGATAPEMKDLQVNEMSKIAGEKDVAILVANRLSQRPDTLRMTMDLLVAGGAVVVTEATPAAADALCTLAKEAGLRMVLRRRLTNGDILVLLRKGSWVANPSHLFVIYMSEGEEFEWVPRMQEALKDPNYAEKRVVLISQGQPKSGILGFINCVCQEPGAGNRLIRCYFMPETTGPQKDAEALLADPEMRARLELDLKVNVLEGGVWGCMRHLSVSSQDMIPSEHAYCNVAVPGDLSSFTWFQGPYNADRELDSEQFLMAHVYYSALNFRDVMLASGKLASNIMPEHLRGQCTVGLEFVGRFSDGKRVMGSSNTSLANIVPVSKDFFWEVPSEWTMEEAASVPIAYSTVIFALDMVGKMKPGESLLVHAGAGAVGQAAINLAIFIGCRVFVTVGTPEKRRFLLETFPQLHPDDIGNSRDASFEYMVMERTKGRGVDLVLNSLADEKLQASLRCLAAKGRFLEIGKVDIMNNTNIDMSKLKDQISIHGIILDCVIASDQVMKMKIKDRVQHFIDVGAVKPIITKVFERDQIEQAYRFMAGGKHIGKIVIRIREEEKARVVKPQKLLLPASPRFFCDDQLSYVICGGLGGLGLELTHWMVNRGARYVVLTSRRGVVSGYQSRRLLQWRKKGVTVHISTEDAATEKGAQTILATAERLAPVGGIFNLAVVLRDAMLENQTQEMFREVYSCKGAATIQLDKASRRMCPALRHFVVFSSVSCGRGNAGQTPYGLANSVMERVIRLRRQEGLPATAVQWGAVGDVGIVADMQDDDTQLEIGGTLQQRLSSCLEVLEKFLALEYPVVSSMVVAEKRAGTDDADLASCVAALLRIRDIKTVSPESSLAELGMDSIIAVEIQQALSREFDVILTPQDVRALTFSTLYKIQRQKLQSEDKSFVAATASVEIQRSMEASRIAWQTTDYVAESEQMRMLVRAIGEEVSSSKPIVAMPSLVEPGTSEGEMPVLIFPGVEGIAHPLESVAKYLDYQVQCVQLGYGETEPDIQAMTNALMPLVERLLVSNATSSGFKIIGYSYGGLIAQEVAARLEASGRGGSGRIVLIDSGIDLMRGYVKNLMKNIDGSSPDLEEKKKTNIQLTLITNILINTRADVTPQVLQNLREEMEALDSWHERLDLLLTRYPQKDHSHNHIVAAFTAIYRRILAILHYDWTHKQPLKARVTLVKPSNSLLPPNTMPEDYNISKICLYPVKVKYVENTDHYSITMKKETGVLINSIFKECEEDDNQLFKESILSTDAYEYRGLNCIARS